MRPSFLLRCGAGCTPDSPRRVLPVPSRSLRRVLVSTERSPATRTSTPEALRREAKTMVLLELFVSVGYRQYHEASLLRETGSLCKEHGPDPASEPDLATHCGVSTTHQRLGACMRTTEQPSRCLLFLGMLGIAVGACGGSDVEKGGTGGSTPSGGAEPSASGGLPGDGSGGTPVASGGAMSGGSNTGGTADGGAVGGNTGGRGAETGGSGG
jgi:hypothetical protein